MRTPDNQNNTPKLPGLDDLTPDIDIEDLTPPPLDLEELQDAQDAATAALDATMPVESSELDDEPDAKWQRFPAQTISKRLFAHAVHIRAMALKRYVPTLTHASRRNIAQGVLEKQLAEGRFNEKYAENPHCQETIARAAHSLWALRADRHAAAIEAAYQAGCDAMSAIGLDFSYLARHHKRKMQEQ